MTAMLQSQVPCQPSPAQPHQELGHLSIFQTWWLVQSFLC